MASGHIGNQTVLLPKTLKEASFPTPSSMCPRTHAPITIIIFKIIPYIKISVYFFIVLYALAFEAAKKRTPDSKGWNSGGFHTNVMCAGHAASRRGANFRCAVKHHALKRCASDGGPSDNSFLVGIGLPISLRTGLLFLLF